MVDHPGHRHGDVLVGGERAAELGALTGREQLERGAGDAPGPVERIVGMATSSEGLLLDAWLIMSSLAPADATT